MGIPWAEIEKEYISTYISQRQISKKYGISLVSLNSHAKAGDWLKKREEFMSEKKQEHDQAKPKPSDIKGLVRAEGQEVEEVGEAKPGSRANFQRYALATLNLAPINKEDPIEVETRINEYFACCYQNGIKPQKPGMAKWIGVSKETLDRWHLGEYRRTTHKPIIDDAFTKLEEDLYDQVQSGHVNPGSGIFLLKNMFGYKDVQDIVVAPKNPLGELQDPEAIRKRIEDTVVLDVDFEEEEPK